MPKKQALRLSIDAELAAKAKAARIDVPALLTDALHFELAKQRRWAEWRDESREAIEASNRQLERDGLPLAKYRVW